MTLTFDTADMNSYLSGEIAIIDTGANGFLDSTTGDPADPSIVTLKVGIVGVASTLITYTYGVGPVIVKDSVGKYHADVDTTNFPTGFYVYQWQGTSGVTTIGYGKLEVKAPPL